MHPFRRSILCRAARVTTLGLVTVSLGALGVFGLGPHTGRYRTLTVLSASMRPAIPEGSVVFVTPVPPRAIRPGDVITYHIPVDDQRVATHRVVEIVEPGDHPVVRTQGDANAAPDPWLARLETDPAWRVRAVVPKLGYVLSALRASPLRRLLVWGLPLLLMVIWLGEIHRRRGQRHDEAVRAFGTPGPHVVLVVPTTQWLNRRAATSTCGDQRAGRRGVSRENVEP